ncbi:SAM hydroxide adenosyltransferase [Haloarcula nitratireducens]|uniref:SAM-dependent chlorinase/fluorinase n=1 Tax=Haloarcula nitratireducens TaxID=2487749 RepID=A0AAW4PKQ8_9EURY|nr:SAM hydroxide adenosyltransferase [Halomicroarcula nitratireducens]MBX0298297.1 SAM-dependent chlorinase/fluorinase [Halomicroarcula nitratireducens]
MSAFIHLIADYGQSDPAFSEVVHRLKYEDQTIDVQTTAVPPFSTVATGFWIAQLALHNPVFDELLVYSNTAPRTEATTPDQADEGGDLCYLELENGVPVVAVDAGYNLSFVRDRIQEYRVIELPATGGQFRSRDVFPTRVVELANGNRQSLGPARSPQTIPSVPDQTVCHVDGYGNIKTSIRASSLDQYSERPTLSINAETKTVTIGEGVADVAEGELGFIPGSAGGSDPYAELFLRGGSAAAAFDHPQPGDSIQFQPS